jgi:hypothetical protein
VDALLDSWDVPLGGDLSKFMQQGISNSDRVLMICTPNYISRANDGVSGGVPYEMMIVRQTIVQAIDTRKFIPIIRDQPGEYHIPQGIGLRFAIDFRDDAQYSTKLEELARAIYGLGPEKPTLGKNPFAAS